MEAGQVLPNGATVVDRNYRRGQITYLCYLEGNLHPWVTWQAREDAPGETFWGHYFKSKSDALEDFKTRIYPYA
jgi:hypothetical protein